MNLQTLKLIRDGINWTPDGPIVGICLFLIPGLLMLWGALWSQTLFEQGHTQRFEDNQSYA
jgi:hypothetical protein